MSKQLLFWAIMILLLITGLWAAWPVSSFRPLAMPLVNWVLLALLGWKVYGPAING